MSEAIHQPVQRARRETVSADTSVPQKPLRQDAAGDSIERGGDIARADASTLIDDYAERLAFNEDPITILLHPSRERNPPLVVDCWVNGRGAEVLVDGKWHQFGCLPINKPVTTRRKYVEVLCLSRTDTVQTDSGSTAEDHPHNRVVRHTSANHTFSVIRDDNPRGAAWLARVLNQAI